MDIQSRASWGAVEPKSRTPMTSPEGWITHWVGAPNMNPVPTLAQSQALMRGLQSQAMKGLHGDVYVDFEYNFAVDPLGRIFEGRGWLVQSGANGTIGYNAHAWSVVYLAGPGVPLTAAAKEALLWLTQTGAKRSGAVSYVTAHRAVRGVSSVCPGDELATYSVYLNAHLHDATVAPPAAPPKEKPMYDPPLKIKSWYADLTKGGAWGLLPDGGVACMGAPQPKGIFGVNGQPWFKGTPTNIVAPIPSDGGGVWYVITNEKSQRYRFNANGAML